MHHRVKIKTRAAEKCQTSKPVVVGLGTSVYLKQEGLGMLDPLCFWWSLPQAAAAQK